jgi:hypothetical protein
MSTNIFPFQHHFPSSQSMISEWFAFSLKEARKRQQNCEIEIRLGKFNLKQETGQSSKWVLLQKLSCQSLIILKTNSKFLNQKYTNKLYLTEVPPFNFEAHVPENNFFQIFENIQKFQQNKNSKSVFHEPSGPIHVKTTNSDSKNELFLDLILKTPSKKKHDTKRIQFDVFSHRAFLENKQDKEFMDVMHNGFQFRISVSFENKTPFDVEELKQLDISKIDCVRIKSRRSWRFEFMSVDMTTSFFLDKKFKFLDKFSQMFLHYLNRTSPGIGFCVDSLLPIQTIKK